MWRRAIVDRAPGRSPRVGRPTSGRFHSEGQSLSTPDQNKEVPATRNKGRTHARAKAQA